MNWQGTRALVTGAGGFIGSHLTEHLVGLGANVRALVHYNALGTHGWLTNSPFIKEIEIVAGDITDRDSIVRAVSGCETVFHLAALIAIPYSYQSPASYIRTNVEGTLNVLQAVRKEEVSCLVHTSTSEVYGTALHVPIKEDHPLQGQSPYSASKIGADKIAEAFNCSFGVPVVTVRPFNTFGPRQSARAVIPTIITQCLTGSVVKLGSLEPTRDLNYVSNTVEGFVAAADHEEAVGKTINLGSGREVSIGDLVELISGLMGKTVRVETESTRLRPANSEVERLLADNTQAHAVLDWHPSVTLEEGLRRTIEWVSVNLNSYRVGSYEV